MRLLLASAAISTLIAAMPAKADDDAASEIVVTGTRYENNLGGTASKTGTDPRNVPAAIVIIPEDVLKDQDVRTLDAALANASAVAPSFGGGYGLADNYVIRGLPMRFLRDGLPDGPTFVGYRRTLADVAGLEVLKGPGSALYGRSEAGGTVNLATRAPDSSFGIEASASYGSFNSWAGTGDVNAPLAENAAVRLIGNDERTDGIRGLARRLVDILPTVTATVGAHKLTFDYDYRDQRSVVDNYGIAFTVNRNLAPVDRDARFYSPFNRVDQRIDRFTIRDEAQAAPEILLRAALVYDRRTLGITRNAGANVINAAGVMTGRGGRTQTDRADYWTSQFEAVLTPRIGPIAHTILLGAEYGATNVATVRRTYVLPDVTISAGTVRAPETVRPGTTTLAFDRRIASDTLSVYGQEQMDIGDHFKIRAGIRYDDVKLVDAGVFGTALARIAGTSSLVSWQAGAVWQPSKAISLYGGYARGAFLSIQTESANLSSNFAKLAPPVPERSTQVEAGAKLALIGGKLNANLAVFETRRDNFFVTLVAGQDPVQAGAQTSRGVEFDVVGTPIADLSIIGNFAYVDAVNRSAALASVTGIATNQPVFGKQLAATPKWSGSLWASYAPSHGLMRGITLGAGAVYKDASFADALELLRVPAYTVLRAAIGYRRGPIEAQVTVNNLTNTAYYSVPTFIGALPGEPRSVQLTLRAKF